MPRMHNSGYHFYLTYRLLRGGDHGVGGCPLLLGGPGTSLQRRYFSFPDRIGCRSPKNCFFLAFSGIRFFQRILLSLTLGMSCPLPGSWSKIRQPYRFRLRCPSTASTRSSPRTHLLHRRAGRFARLHNFYPAPADRANV